MAFIHGGNILAVARELGVKPSELIDMSSNLTPLGPVPGLEPVYREAFAEIGCLPDATSESLRGVFCAKFQCDLSEVVAGNGTTEFIYDLAVKIAARRIIIVNPTYSDYKLGCEYNDKEWRSYTLLPPNFNLSLTGLGRDLVAGDLVFICNPNNPTGTMVDSARLHEFIRLRPEINFVVDESYLPFTHEVSLIHFPRLANLFILCSSSKIYGIPGLRLGFMVSAKDSLRPILSRQKPWVVNRPAQLCGEFLLREGDSYIARVLAFIDRVKPEFVESLNQIAGLETVAGVTNFILCRLASSRSVADFRADMLQRRIMIRDCYSFDGLSDQYFRISLQSEERNNKCLQAMKECLS